MNAAEYISGRYMDTQTGVTGDLEMPNDEEFEEEKVVKEEAEYTYYVRQSMVVFTFKLLFVQFVILLAHALAYMAVVASGTTSDNLMISLIIAAVVIQAINLFFVLYLTLHWVKTTYVIKPHFVLEHQGILSLKESKYSTDRIESVEVNQSLFGKIFNYGSVELYSPALQADFSLQEIPHPYIYAKLIGGGHPKEAISFIHSREDVTHKH